MIKTSVIIPVYNTAAYLPQCLDSVLAQTQKEIEIITVDDGSTDNSLEILNIYQKRYKNIYVLTQQNNRQGAARNRGVSCAGGKYIYFLDSDDYIDKETLESCYNLAERERLDVVLFDSKVKYEDILPAGFKPDSFDRTAIIKNENRIYTGFEFLAEYMDYDPDTVSPCMMYLSKAMLDTNDISFIPEVYYEDEEYRLKVMLRARRLMYIPKLFYNRRYRVGSTMTYGYSNERIFNLVRVIKQMVGNLVNDDISWITRKYIEKKMWMLLDRTNLLRQEEKDSRLSENILALLKQFWEKFNMPNDIEDIKFRLFYIKYLERIFPDISWANELEIAEKQRIVMLKKLNLDNSKLSIGIIGDKNRKDQLLNEFRDNVGTVSSKIVHIDVIEKLTVDIVSALDYIALVSDSYKLDNIDHLRSIYGKRLPICVLCDKDGNFLL